MEKYKINKPVRLIELFTGIGAFATALEYLNIDFEKYVTSEWEVNAVASYKAIHCKDDMLDYSNMLTITDIENHLINWGISTDGKNSLTEQQIKRRSEKWKRNTYNNFRATNNIGSIINAKGSDLGIVDTYKYEYIFTYSFPCQALSLAGKREGMVENSGTSSSLLWEVKRLLNECLELPQILIMENVPQVHGKKNLPEFERWMSFLEDKGYNNYWYDMNAKDYGIPQSRNRCFMVSILNGYYEFPSKIPLKFKFKDFIEDKVEEKYYIDSTRKQCLLEQLIENNELRERESKWTTDGTINKPKYREIANCIKARIDAGITNFKAEGNCVIEKM